MGQPQSKNGFATSDELPDLTAYITMLDYIKSGGQADVRKARIKIKNESKIVAVKQLRHTDEAVKLAHLEMKMWRKANGHVNVVQLLGKTLDPRNSPSMVSEFCEHGDLLSYTFSVARFNYKDLLCDVLQGLTHIHQLNLAHGDLKPENIVLTVQSKRLTAKICDFGSTRDVLSKGRISTEYICTALYRSPELATEEEEIQSPSFAADVWAFGCVAFVVLCKKLPYHWVKNRWTIDIFIASRKLPHAEDDKWPEASLRHIVQSCWCDMAIRPSASALLRRMTSPISTHPVSRLSPSPVPLPLHERKLSSLPSTNSRGSRSSRRARRPIDSVNQDNEVIPEPAPPPFIPAPRTPSVGVVLPHISESPYSLRLPSISSSSPQGPPIVELSPPSARASSARSPSELSKSVISISEVSSVLELARRFSCSSIQPNPSQAEGPLGIQLPESIGCDNSQISRTCSQSSLKSMSTVAEESLGTRHSHSRGPEIVPSDQSPPRHGGSRGRMVSDGSVVDSPRSASSGDIYPGDSASNNGQRDLPSVAPMPALSCSRSGSYDSMWLKRSPSASLRSETPSRSHSRSHSPARVIGETSPAISRSPSPGIIPIDCPSRTSPEKPPSRSPTEVIEVGGPSRSPRSRSRSPSRIVRTKFDARLARLRSRSRSQSHARNISTGSRSRSHSPHIIVRANRPTRRALSRSIPDSPGVIGAAGSSSRRPRFRSRRSRSRSHSPSRIIHVGGSGSRSSRPISRSPTRISPEPPLLRRSVAVSPPDIMDVNIPSRSHRPRSYSRSPTRVTEDQPIQYYGGRSPVSPSTRRPIVIDINVTLESDDPDHEPRRIRHRVRVPMPSRYRARRISPERTPHVPTTRTSPRRRPTIIIPQDSLPSARSRQHTVPQLANQSDETALRSEARDAQSAESSIAASELEQRFAHQASYTRLRRTLHAGKIVIKKSLRRTSAKYTKTPGAIYLNYAQDMFDLKHKNLVDIYGVSAEPSANGFLIMESYSTNLLSYRESLDYQNQLRVFCEVLEGLQALHTSVPPIAHQCLKASNIMVDEHGSVKLSLMNSEPYLAFAVKPSPTRSYSPNWPIVSRWWSPEVFKDKTKLLTVENDIWAFGCVVLEVLTGSAPYPKFEEDPSLVNHIRAGHSPDSGLRRAPKLRMWQDVRRCWSTPRPTTGYMLNVFCDYLAREVMRGVPDLTAQIAKAANPFVRGRTSDIYSGIYTNRRERSEQVSVAVKHVRSNNTAQRTHFIQWLGGCAQNRQYFDHENICSLLGVMYSARLGPLLVLEHHAGGTLHDYMRTNGAGLSTSDKLLIMSDILSALVHLHEHHHTAWGDLHPTNIVLDHNGSPKLCGLGPRASLHHEAASQNDLAVLRYFAPERFQPEATMSHAATDI